MQINVMLKGNRHFISHQNLFSSQEIASVKEYMRNCDVRGTIRDPIATNGGKFSHDKLVYALNHARNTLGGKGDAAVTENILQLFDMIRYLWSRSFSRTDLIVLQSHPWSKIISYPSSQFSPVVCILGI